MCQEISSRDEECLSSTEAAQILLLSVAIGTRYDHKTLVTTILTAPTF